MRAAVLKGVFDLELTNVPTPKAQDGEVLVRVEACGICRTDMKAYTQGQRDLKLPRILGHEITGRVADTGCCVSQFQVGDRVQVAPGLSCGYCSYCLKGQDNMCSDVKIMGFDYDGGFAEYVLVPNRGVRNGVINIMPDHISFYQAVLTEPLACSINMHDAIKIGQGDTVAIYGAGPLGILNARLAKARGASMVLLIERNEARMTSYLEKGFDYCINSLKLNPITAVLDITNGQGIDVVIPCCPSTDIVGEGIKMLSKKGRFGFFSGLLETKQLHVNFNNIHYKELMICGAYGCSAEHNRLAMGLISTGTVNVQDMVSRVIGIEEVADGLRAVKDLEEIKIAIQF